MSEIRVNRIVNAAGSGAPQFPSGFSLATGMGITNSPNITGSAVTFSGLAQITNSTDSTSSTTGALVVTGGVGIAKDVYIGAGLSVAGTLTYEDVTNVDAVGLITARSGLNVSGGEVTVGTGVTISSTAGVATFAKDVTFLGAGGNITFDHSADDLIFNDVSKLMLGSDSDMEVYHNGSHGYITNTTGTLYIQPKSGENSVICVADAETKLYHANNHKFSTTNEGVSITGFTSTTAGLGVTGGMWEGAFIKAGKLTDNKTLGISTSNIFVFTTAETTTGTPNIVWNDTYALSSKMKVGDAVTITVITTAAGYCANWKIDGTAVTEQWNGGSAPSSGGSDGYDIYTHTLVRKASGTGDTGWFMFSNVSNFT